MMVDVSVVIPTFRRPQQLREAVQSALSQEGVSVEVVIVDDSPEGSAADIAREYGHARVRYLRCEPPTGGNPAIVRNVGWPEACGTFVHFLDDDDVALPGAYRGMVAALRAAPAKGMVFGGVEPFGTDAAALDRERAYFALAARRARLADRLGSRRLHSAFMLFHSTMLVNSACMIRRACIAPLGGYRHDVRVVEDVDFYSRVIRRFGSVYLDRPVIGYRCGASSIMSDQKDSNVVATSYGKMYDAYRGLHGLFEFAALKSLSRTVLRFFLALITLSPAIVDPSEARALRSDGVAEDSRSEASSRHSTLRVSFASPSLGSE